MGGVVQRSVCLHRHKWIPVSRELTPHIWLTFVSPETVSSLFSTGWFQEQIRVLFHNRT